MLKKVILLLLIVPTLLFAKDNQVIIPAGNFVMGCVQNDDACESDELPAKVYVGTFLIDKTEVTVADYEKCVQTGQCNKPLDSLRNPYCNYGLLAKENHPVNCINWQDALSYCQAQGKRLPYEAEWEKAAKAKSTTPYPWGDNVTCKNAILDDGQTTGSVEDELDGCGEDSTWAVGTRPANGYGLYDMNGNVSEWVMNWYSKNAINALYAQGQLAKPNTGNQKVAKGGGWDDNSLSLRTSFRNVKPPKQMGAIYAATGFRCASDR